MCDRCMGQGSTGVGSIAAKSGVINVFFTCQYCFRTFYLPDTDLVTSEGTDTLYDSFSCPYCRSTAFFTVTAMSAVRQAIRDDRSGKDVHVGVIGCVRGRNTADLIE